MTYSEKLRDPRWQRKRLEILARDGWTCELCSSTSRTLHVHHGYYDKDYEPWDYPNETLHTLCDECHEEIKNVTAYLYQDIAKLPVGELYEVGKWLVAKQEFLNLL